MKLSLDIIQTIDAVERTGSFSAAAELLHKVPSTISYTITKAEEQMGVEFFERNGPRITLTPIGAELLKDGRCILDASLDLETRLRKMQHGYEADLTIALDALFPFHNITKEIETFQKEGFTTRLHFQHEVLTGTWEALMLNRANLVVAAGAGPSGGGYKSHILGQIDFAFCVAPSHPLAKAEEPLEKNQLLRYTAIVIGDSARQFSLRSTGLYDGQKNLTVSTLDDKILLQKEGIGHGFLPRPWVRNALKHGELIEKQVVEPKADETFCLAWRTEEGGKTLDWWRNKLIAIGERICS